MRVRKLMDKAAATTNPHEADAFSRKAAELVSRHRLDLTTVQRGVTGTLAVRTVELGRGGYVRARLALLMAIADAHDVRVVFGGTPTGTVAYAAGFTSDLDVVEVLYHSLHLQASTQMAAVRRPTSAATQRFRRSFLFGYAERIGQLLAESRRAVEADAGVGDSVSRSGSSTELALLARREQVDDFAAQSFGRVRTARAPGAAQVHGWHAGSAAADRADVARAKLPGQRQLGRGRN